MKSLFSLDSPVFRFFDVIFNLFLLTIVWTVCSLPVVTIGASTTALFYVTLRMVHNEESYVVQNFFKGFRTNFKQATGLWIGFLAFGLVLGLNYYAYFYGMKDVLPSWIIPILIIVTVIYAAVMMYAFPLLARYENTNKQVFRNAVILMVKYLFRTILMLVSTVIIIAVIAWNRYTIFGGALLGAGVISYTISSYMIRIFEILERDYMQPDEGDDGPAEAEEQAQAE